MTWRAAAAPLALALLAGAAALSSCDGGTGKPPAPAPPPPPPPAAASEPFSFLLRGPQPWNSTVYAAVGDAIDRPAPYHGCVIDDRRVFVVSGPPGAPYHVRSEQQPSPPELRMLWMVDARGTLGAAGNGVVVDPMTGAVVVTAPPRATVTLLAPSGSGGPDVVTFYREDPATCATAYRDPRHGYFLAVWDAEHGNCYRNIAPPRPWTIEDIRPGAYVIGARTEGHQWTARRVTITPEAPFQIDAGAAPPGGGTVVCENGQALLLLNGDLPIPAWRITTELQYRCTWKGVPPGRHKVRYPDGREVDVDVQDGTTTKIGR